MGSRKAIGSGVFSSHLKEGGRSMVMGHMGDLYNFIIGIIGGWTPRPGTGGSVPGPETLLAFGLGFLAFVVWRAKRVEE